MATLLQIYNLRYEGTELKAKAAAAIAKAAYDVLNEDAQTAQHAERVAWAKESLTNTQQMADRMMWGMLQNASIQTNGNASSDNDIQFVVNSLINSYLEF